MAYVVSLSNLRRSDLALAGGKAANLGELLHGGFPVPPGFCVTTAAYRDFARSNGLEEQILRRCAGLEPDAQGRIAPALLEAASAAIRSLFTAPSAFPPAFVDEIHNAYAAIDRPPCAVRSSATAEDLPDLSFAGQQDTYLNVVGETALLDAVVHCWASLWTARAIGYRARAGIPHSEVALAVVVQAMVESEASGVLFTANPLSGRRTESVIDATLGLGEALVSGQVDPDHYVVADERITFKTVGRKALSIRGRAGGGTAAVEEAAAPRQALPDEQILALARLGQQVERHFGGPQDLEWAWAGGELHLVQSRPITSLYPLPSDLDPTGPLRVLFSFGAVQGMLDPITPLGRDVFGSMAGAISTRLDRPTTLATQGTFFTAGERLFLNFTGLVNSREGRRISRAALGAAEPVSQSVLDTVVSDPRLDANPRSMSIKTRLRLARVILPLAARVLGILLRPESSRDRHLAALEQVLESVSRRTQAARSLTEKLDILEMLLKELPGEALAHMLPLVIAGQAAFQPLIRAASALPVGAQTALELSRGAPGNVTTEMDLALWGVSRRIHADPEARRCFEAEDLPELVDRHRAGSLPPTAQAAVNGFLRRYGMRGPFEIDIGRPRWREDPMPLFQALVNYLRIDDDTRAPDVVFARGEAQAAAAEERLVAALRRTPRGRIKAFLARLAARRVRVLVGQRETPKFTMIRAFGMLRDMLVEEDLAANISKVRSFPQHPAGQAPEASQESSPITGPTHLLENTPSQGEKGPGVRSPSLPPPIFFLHISELRALAAGQNRDWAALIAAHREAYERELRRRQVPRLMLSDGTAFYERVEPPTAASPGAPGDLPVGVIAGSPVSPGVVEGRARVILDPRGAHLEPGEILVCPATDPGWTPLFLAAGGLVMEIGGMMTHGSVVAREYGIPAVVGVTQATTRIHTGQLLRVDGTAGKVYVLDGEQGSVDQGSVDQLTR